MIFHDRVRAPPIAWRSPSKAFRGWGPPGRSGMACLEYMVCVIGMIGMVCMVKVRMVCVACVVCMVSLECMVGTVYVKHT